MADFCDVMAERPARASLVPAFSIVDLPFKTRDERGARPPFDRCSL